jgi:peptidoglycan/LPS O-acetylase OafA/YrhL
MSATSPLGAVGALGIALLTVGLLQRRFGAPLPARQFSTIDGLRGYAAFLVFLHHSAAWYFFARTGVWAPPPSRLYTHFGQSSVAIFFMITGLLFWSKILDGRARPLDWRRLYVSRVLRLTPLFVLLVALLWMVALMLSGGRLRESGPRAILQTFQWLTFTMFGMPNINFAPTSIIGGAAWSLPYEWWFYFSLPLAALFVGLRSSRGWLTLSLTAVIAAAWWVSNRGSWINASVFLGGIVTAVAVRQPGIHRAARHPTAAIVCIGAIIAASRFETAFAPAPLLLLSVAFSIIACGNSLFGSLEWAAARSLGEIGYSVYLLHGVVLFVAFGWLFRGLDSPAGGTAGHWAVVYACAAFVPALSFFTFRMIEAPAMASVDRVNAWLTRRKRTYSHPTVA